MTQSLLPPAHVFTGAHPGPRVLLLAGVHGDETPGIDGLSGLLPQLGATVTHGTLTVITPVNRAAVAAQTRFLESDLNRLWSAEQQARLADTPPSQHTHEEALARELSAHLQAADFVLDLHSTGQPSRPFLYCEHTPAHRAIATQIGVSTIVYGNPDWRLPSLTSSIDNFVDQHGGLGFTLESGWKSDPSTIPLIQSCIWRFLSLTGTTQTPPNHLRPLPETVEQFLPTHEVQAPSSEAIPLVEWASFTPIEAKQPLLRGSPPTLSPVNGVLLFPKSNFTAGHLATYIATPL